MSKTVDNRVVQMEFDNQQFERGVKQSMNSLSQLDGSLNKLNKNSSANGLTTALNSIQNALSNINPTRWHWIDRLWNEVEKLGSHIMSKLIAPLNTMKEGGWGRALSLEQARFQFEGLGIDVEKAMKSANDAVADTAYGLDEAATAASMLTTSGVEAGDELTKALTAISGVTAQVNGQYSDIANIFTDIAAAGKVTGDSLTRLSYRGLNAAQVLGEAMGKSAADVKKLASQGKISFKEFYEAMYDKYAEHAYKANETYTGSLANMNAALKKIGADFGQYKLKEMVSLHNSLRLAINKVRKELTPVSEAYGKIFSYVVKFATTKIDAFNAKPLQKVIEGLANILTFVVNILNEVKKSIINLFPRSAFKSFDQIATAFRDFTERLQLTSETVQLFKNIFGGLIAFFDIFKQLILGIAKAIIPGVDSIGDLVSVILNVLSYIGQLTMALDQWIKESNVVATVINTVKNSILTILVVIAALIAKVVELVKAIKDSEIVANIISKVTKAFETFKSTFSSFTKTVKEADKVTSSSSGESKSGGLFAGVSASLEKLLAIVKKIVGEITPAKVIIAAFVVFIGGLAIAFAAAAHKIGDSMKQTSGVLNNFWNAWMNFKKKTAEAEEKKEKSKKWASFLIVVAELTALAFALKGLASQPLSHILAATVAMGAIIYEVWKIVGDIALMPNKEKVEKNLKSMKGIALLIAAVGVALSIAAKKPWQELLAAGVAMSLCMQSVIATVEMIGKIDTASISKTIDTMGKMSSVVASFPVIARAIHKLRDMDVGSIVASAIGMSAAILAIGKTVQMMSKVKEDGISLKKIAAIIALCVGCEAIGNALSKAATNDWTAIAFAAAGISGTMLAMTLIVKILSKIDDGKKAIVAAASMAIMSLSLIPVAKAMQELSFYNWADMGQKMIALNGTLVVMAAVLGVLASIGAASEGIGLAALAVVAASLIGMGYAMEIASKGVLTIAQALKILQNVNIKSIAEGMMYIVAAVNNFPVLKTIGLAAACMLGGNGFLAFARGIQEFANADLSGLATNISTLFDAIAQSSTSFVDVGANLTALGVGLNVIAEAISKAGLAMVPLGIGLAIAGVGVLAAGAGLKIMAPALQIMQDLDWDTLGFGLTQVASAIEKFAVAGAVMSLVSAGLAVAAVSLGAIALECYAFTKIDLIAIAKGLATIASVGLKVGVAGLEMGIGAVGFGAMAVAIATLGKVVQTSAVLIYNGVKITINALELLKKAGSFSVQGFVSGIGSSLSSVAKMGANLGSTFVKAVCNFLGIHSPSTLLRKVGDFTGLGFVNGIADMMDEAEKSGKSLGLSAIMGTEGLSDMATKAGQALGLDFSGGFVDVIDQVLGGVGKNLARTGANGMPSDIAAKMSKGGLNGLTNSVKDLLGVNLDLDESLKNVTASAGGAGDALSSMGDGAKKGAKGVKEAKDEIKSFVEKIEGSFNILDEFDLGIDEENPLTKDKLISNMKSNIEGMAKWSNEMESLSGKVAQGLYKKLADMGPQGYKYVHAFTEMTKEELELVNTYYATSLVIPTNVTTQVYRGMADAGNNALTGYIEGLNIPYWQDLGVELATNFLTGMKGSTGLETHSPSKKTEEIGVYAIEGFSNGLRDMSAKEGMFYTIQNLCREILQKFRTGLSAQDFKDIGKQILRGLDLGINSKQPDVLASVSSLSEKIIEKTKNIFQIKSPSRVFAEIGGYIDQGLANGIADNIGTVESSVNTMAQATVDNMREAVSTIQTVLDNDLDVEPVIRPVVDMSNVQNGVGSINSLMSTFGSDVTMPSASFMTTSNLISNTDNTSVVDAIGGLQEDVINLKDAMTNIKMVLDTGTMVGAMTPAIDMELGSRQVLAGRGI